MTTSTTSDVLELIDAMIEVTVTDAATLDTMTPGSTTRRVMEQAVGQRLATLKEVHENIRDAGLRAFEVGIER